jgi:hypothetical protein
MAISRYGTRFQTFGTGGKYSANYESYEVIPQFIERIKVQRSKFPLLLISEKMKNHKPVKYKTYYHTESDELPLTVQVNGAINSTATSLVLDATDSKYIRPYDQLYNPLTEEQLHVSAVNTTTYTATVTRGVGNSGTGSNIADNQQLLIMSQSNAEGGTSQSGVWGTSVQVSNYTMLTREPYEMTDESENTDAYGYDNPWQEAKNDASIRLARKMEWQALFGKADNGNTSGYRSTGGLGHFVSSHKLDVAGALTEEAFYNWLRDLSVDNGGLDDLLFFAGSYILGYMDAWGRDRMYQRPEDTVAGIAISRYKTSFGEMKVLQHGMLTEVFDTTSTPELPGMMFGVNMSMLKFVYWRPLKNDEGPQGRGIQANDSLTKKGEWRAHWGCYVGDERKHGWMYGVTELT